jgi:glycosyltransferase involved in cell wall biosynthesis
VAQAAVMASRPVPGRTRYVGIVVPVHDEEELLGGALEALEAAVDQVGAHIRCHTVLVYDACRDRSRQIAAAWSRDLRRRGIVRLVSEIDIAARNVGSARRAGCALALTAAAEANVAPRSTWLATTDADSRVPRDWLSVQIASHEAGTDVWSGSVTVRDWMHRAHGTAAEWLRLYEAELDPAHGASLAINGQVYVDAGQFEQLTSGEDRALLCAASALGARIHYDRTAPVMTSARLQARAPHGFASALQRVEEQVRLGQNPRVIEDLSA